MNCNEECKRNAFKPIDDNPIILDFSACKYLGEVHKILKSKFGLPEYYGENWDALWDCLRYLWSDGKKDDAFEALDCALTQFRYFGEFCAKGARCYTAPLVRLIQPDATIDDSRPPISYASLVEDWPWWCVPEASNVKSEIQADPRWHEWVAKTRACDQKN